jgi:hypothetical protein
LYHQGLLDRIVFTDANAPTTTERFPRGETVHYREHTIRTGTHTVQRRGQWRGR